MLKPARRVKKKRRRKEEDNHSWSDKQGRTKPRKGERGRL